LLTFGPVEAYYAEADAWLAWLAWLAWRAWWPRAAVCARGPGRALEAYDPEREAVCAWLAVEAI
jgi:hypothetical protein